MVILGGLEIVAAGYLLNEFNKDKVEARERRKHSRPHDDEGRPHSNSTSKPPPSSNYLAPPSSHPPRPLSAPPQNTGPGPGFGQAQWQQPPPALQEFPVSPYPHQNMGRPHSQSQGAWHQGPPLPGPGHLQHAQTFAPQQGSPSPGPQFHGQPPPPGPGPMQFASTPFQPQQQRPPQPFVQQAQTFPIQHQPFKPPPPGPLTYIDTKTGRISHNMYPPDHPMARGGHDGGGEAPRDLWGDKRYQRAMAGDINTGLVWSEKDEDDLAYGKDYSSSRQSDAGRFNSYERRRDRGRSSPLQGIDGNDDVY